MSATRRAFAKSAVTLVRGLTATFAGIRPDDVTPYVLAQLAGASLALLADRALRPAN